MNTIKHTEWIVEWNDELQMDERYKRRKLNGNENEFPKTKRHKPIQSVLLQLLNFNVHPWQFIHNPYESPHFIAEANLSP